MGSDIESTTAERHRKCRDHVSRTLLMVVYIAKYIVVTVSAYNIENGSLTKRSMMVKKRVQELHQVGIVGNTLATSSV